MKTVRRVYVYLVAFIGLVMVTAGLSGLLRDILTRGTNNSIAFNAALTLAGLPLWLLHWLLARRAARRDVLDRAAPLRRLYIYAALGYLVTAFALNANTLLDDFFSHFSPGAIVTNPMAPLQTVPGLVIFGCAWLYHRQCAIADRVAVGETGAAATLRRWYRYLVSAITLLVVLIHIRNILKDVWQALLTHADNVKDYTLEPRVAHGAALLLVSLGLWLSHWLGTAIQRRDEPATQELSDSQSVLRLVYLFLALGVSVGTALFGASQILYYALARLLGVADPGGVSGNLAVALSGPVTLFIVFGGSWLYQRWVLATHGRDRETEIPRQLGVRRLYVYIISLLSLGLWTGGAGVLLWVGADFATRAAHPNNTHWWQDQVSLGITMLLVGLAVWLREWGPVAGRTDEQASFSRRLYVYVSLLGGVLTLLSVVFASAYQTFNALLGGSVGATLARDLARNGATALVAIFVVAYHFRILQTDGRAKGMLPSTSQTAADNVQTADVSPELPRCVCGEPYTTRARFCLWCGQPVNVGLK